MRGSFDFTLMSKSQLHKTLIPTEQFKLTSTRSELSLHTSDGKVQSRGQSWAIFFSGEKYNTITNTCIHWGVHHQIMTNVLW